MWSPGPRKGAGFFCLSQQDCTSLRRAPPAAFRLAPAWPGESFQVGQPGIKVASVSAEHSQVQAWWVTIRHGPFLWPLRGQHTMCRVRKSVVTGGRVMAWPEGPGTIGLGGDRPESC